MGAAWARDATVSKGNLPPRRAKRRSDDLVPENPEIGQVCALPKEWQPPATRGSGDFLSRMESRLRDRHESVLASLSSELDGVDSAATGSCAVAGGRCRAIVDANNAAVEAAISKAGAGLGEWDMRRLAALWREIEATFGIEPPEPGDDESDDDLQAVAQVGVGSVIASARSVAGASLASGVSSGTGLGHRRRLVIVDPSGIPDDPFISGLATGTAAGKSAENGAKSAVGDSNAGSNGGGAGGKRRVRVPPSLAAAQSLHAQLMAISQRRSEGVAAVLEGYAARILAAGYAVTPLEIDMGKDGNGTGANGTGGNPTSSSSSSSGVGGSDAAVGSGVLAARPSLPDVLSPFCAASASRDAEDTSAADEVLLLLTKDIAGRQRRARREWEGLVARWRTERESAVIGGFVKGVGTPSETTAAFEPIADRGAANVDDGNQDGENENESGKGEKSGQSGGRGKGGKPSSAKEKDGGNTTTATDETEAETEAAAAASIASREADRRLRGGIADLLSAIDTPLGTVSVPSIGVYPDDDRRTQAVSKLGSSLSQFADSLLEGLFALTTPDTVPRIRSIVAGKSVGEVDGIFDPVAVSGSDDAITSAAGIEIVRKVDNDEVVERLLQHEVKASKVRAKTPLNTLKAIFQAPPSDDGSEGPSPEEDLELEIFGPCEALTNAPEMESQRARDVAIHLGLFVRKLDSIITGALSELDDCDAELLRAHEAKLQDAVRSVVSCGLVDMGSVADHPGLRECHEIVERRKMERATYRAALHSLLSLHRERVVSTLTPLVVLPARVAVRFERLRVLVTAHDRAHRERLRDIAEGGDGLEKPADFYARLVEDTVSVAPRVQRENGIAKADGAGKPALGNGDEAPGGVSGSPSSLAAPLSTDDTATATDVAVAVAGGSKSGHVTPRLPTPDDRIAKLSSVVESWLSKCGSAAELEEAVARGLGAVAEAEAEERWRADREIDAWRVWADTRLRLISTMLGKGCGPLLRCEGPWGDEEIVDPADEAKKRALMVEKADKEDDDIESEKDRSSKKKNKARGKSPKPPSKGRRSRPSTAERKTSDGNGDGDGDGGDGDGESNNASDAGGAAVKPLGPWRGLGGSQEEDVDVVTLEDGTVFAITAPWDTDVQAMREFAARVAAEEAARAAAADDDEDGDGDGGGKSGGRNGKSDKSTKKKRPQSSSTKGKNNNNGKGATPEPSTDPTTDTGADGKSSNNNGKGKGDDIDNDEDALPQRALAPPGPLTVPLPGPAPFSLPLPPTRLRRVALETLRSLIAEHDTVRRFHTERVTAIVGAVLSETVTGLLPALRRAVKGKWRADRMAVLGKGRGEFERRMETIVERARECEAAFESLCASQMGVDATGEKGPVAGLVEGAGAAATKSKSKSKGSLSPTSEFQVLRKARARSDREVTNSRSRVAVEEALATWEGFDVPAWGDRVRAQLTGRVRENADHVLKMSERWVAELESLVGAEQQQQQQQQSQGATEETDNMRHLAAAQSLLDQLRSAVSRQESIVDLAVTAEQDAVTLWLAAFRSKVADTLVDLEFLDGSSEIASKATAGAKLLLQQSRMEEERIDSLLAELNVVAARVPERGGGAETHRSNASGGIDSVDAAGGANGTAAGDTGTPTPIDPVKVLSTVAELRNALLRRAVYLDCLEEEFTEAAELQVAVGVDSLGDPTVTGPPEIEEIHTANGGTGDAADGKSRGGKKSGGANAASQKKSAKKGGKDASKRDTGKKDGGGGKKKDGGKKGGAAASIDGPAGPRPEFTDEDIAGDPLLAQATAISELCRYDARTLAASLYSAYLETGRGPALTTSREESGIAYSGAGGVNDDKDNDDDNDGDNDGIDANDPVSSTQLQKRPAIASLPIHRANNGGSVLPGGRKKTIPGTYEEFCNAHESTVVAPLLESVGSHVAQSRRRLVAQVSGWSGVGRALAAAVAEVARDACDSAGVPLGDLERSDQARAKEDEALRRRHADQVVAGLQAAHQRAALMSLDSAEKERIEKERQFVHLHCERVITLGGSFTRAAERRLARVAEVGIRLLSTGVGTHMIVGGGEDQGSESSRLTVRQLASLRGGVSGGVPEDVIKARLKIEERVRTTNNSTGNSTATPQDRSTRTWVPPMGAGRMDINGFCAWAAAGLGVPAPNAESTESADAGDKSARKKTGAGKKEKSGAVETETAAPEYPPFARTATGEVVFPTEPPIRVTESEAAEIVSLAGDIAARRAKNAAGNDDADQASSKSKGSKASSKARPNSSTGAKGGSSQGGAGGDAADGSSLRVVSRPLSLPRDPQHRCVMRSLRDAHRSLSMLHASVCVSSIRSLLSRIDRISGWCSAWADMISDVVQGVGGDAFQVSVDVKSIDEITGGDATTARDGKGAKAKGKRR